MTRISPPSAAATPDPAPPRGRGAPKGNTNALKHGRHTAAAKAERAAATALLRRVRRIVAWFATKAERARADLRAMRDRLEPILDHLYEIEKRALAWIDFFRNPAAIAAYISKTIPPPEGAA